jgi:hypothetical protein
MEAECRLIASPDMRAPLVPSGMFGKPVGGNDRIFLTWDMLEGVASCHVHVSSWCSAVQCSGADEWSRR